MFLANSLKEKLRRSYLESETDSMSSTANAKFAYVPPKKDPRQIVSFKEPLKNDPSNNYSSSWNLNTQQLQSLDKTDWENTFTLKNLHEKWQGKNDLDFELNFKKFTDDAIYPRAFPAKELVKDLTDPDILELKRKRWNISNNTKEKSKPELSKIIFEVGNGLKDFQVVPLKEQKVNVGVDSRDHLEVDGNIWNISNLFNEKKFKKQGDKFLTIAQENSIRYWRENDENREFEKPFPIDEDRKKIEVIRYFKKYRSPFQKTIDYERDMDKVKKMTILERENVEKKVIYNNPGLEKYPEKINALIFKDLQSTYDEKYKEITGKLSKEELKKIQFGNNFKWKDNDLVNKIIAINKLKSSGLLGNEKIPKNNYTNRLCKSQQKAGKNILLPLIIKGNEIEKEEEKIKDKIQEEFKKEQKRQLLLEAKSFKKKATSEKFESRYPLTQDQYDFIKNKKDKIIPKDFVCKNDEELYNKINYITSTSPNLSSEMTTSLLNEISKSADCDPHFLEAYSKIAGKELEKISEKNKKNKEEVTFKYTHPGTYREFTFNEKCLKPKVVRNDAIDSLPPQDDEYVTKKVTSSFWSCCMKADKDAPGCQKTVIKNFKWLYD